MGLNSFDWQMELWPKAHWGNFCCYVIKKKTNYLHNGSEIELDFPFTIFVANICPRASTIYIL